MKLSEKSLHHIEKDLSLSNELRQALASLRLEGIKLSSESIADLLLFDKGKITKEEIIKKALDRVKSKKYK